MNCKYLKIKNNYIFLWIFYPQSRKPYEGLSMMAAVRWNGRERGEGRRERREETGSTVCWYPQRGQEISVVIWELNCAFKKSFRCFVMLKHKTETVCILKIGVLLCFWQYTCLCLLCTLTIFSVSKRIVSGSEDSKQNKLHPRIILV